MTKGEKWARAYATQLCGPGLKSNPNLNRYTPAFMADAYLAGWKARGEHDAKLVEPIPVNGHWMAEKIRQTDTENSTAERSTKMDNRTEDQKRLERIEHELVRLREMVLTLLSQSNRDFYRAQIQSEFQASANRMHQHSEMEPNK